MSIIEDQIFDREAAMGEHIERDETNNRKIVAYLRTRIDADTLHQVSLALSSGSNQTFTFHDSKLGLGYDGLYHVFQRGADGKFFEVELPDETSEEQRAA